LQLETNCNSFDPLQLPKTIATGPDLVATRCKPIAAIVGLVATDQKSIEIMVGAFSIQNAPMCIIAKHYIYTGK
jgi:hypothetical protein